MALQNTVGAEDHLPPMNTQLITQQLLLGITTRKQQIWSGYRNTLFSKDFPVCVSGVNIDRQDAGRAVLTFSNSSFFLDSEVLKLFEMAVGIIGNWIFLNIIQECKLKWVGFLLQLGGLMELVSKCSKRVGTLGWVWQVKAQLLAYSVLHWKLVLIWTDPM